MTGNERAGTRILGSLRSADGKGVVRIQDRFDTDIDDVWSALTDPRRPERSGDRTPDRTQRLLNRAVWDTFAAMGVVRRFAVAGWMRPPARPAGRAGWRSARSMKPARSRPAPARPAETAVPGLRGQGGQRDQTPSTWRMCGKAPGTR